MWDGMTQFTAKVHWQRNDEVFLDNRYSRKHVLSFDGGIEVPGSSSPHVVPVPMSDEEAIDPEEAFIASISSCHMLWFLSIAVQHGFRVDEYYDQAVGVMSKNSAGKTVVSEVTLRPKVFFSGDRKPTQDQLNEMHHEAHSECFIANSVKTNVCCQPVFVD